MNCLSIYLIISLIFVKQSVHTATIRKYFYQKDLSEYCKRRVVPSVFLGRNVVEAHSKILHFSRMDLPYSCFISVRAESGSNVMLVAQLPSDESLVSACSENPSQLLVYEMGETFGGYWGPLPESVVRPEPTEPDVYTRETTERDIMWNRKLTFPHTTKLHETTKSNEDAKPAVTKDTEENLVRVIVPIVNVSGTLESDGGPLESGFDPDDIFDLLYDVTPRNGGVYQTSLLPVVQFSIQKSSGQKDGDFRYNLEYGYHGGGRGTTKARLFPHYTERSTRRKTFRTNFYAKKLMTMKKTRPRSTKHTKHYFRKNIHASSASPTNLERVKDSTSYVNDLYKPSFTTSNGSVTTWDKDIQEIIRKLNKSSSHLDKYNNENKNIRGMDVISNMKHNRSVYLLPNWDVFMDQPYRNDHGIQDLLQKLNGSSSHKEQYVTENNNVTRLLESISNTGHNRSVYLLPNWDSFVDQIEQNHQLNAFTKQFGGSTRKTLGTLSSFSYASTKNIQRFLKPTRSKLLISTKETNTEIIYGSINNNKVSKSTTGYKQMIVSMGQINVTDKSEQSTVKVLANVTEMPTGITQVQSSSVTTELIPARVTKPIKGTMVNHESWENVVQAAPVMAELLNQTVSVNYKRNYTTQDVGETSTKQGNVRVKRKIQPIPIEYARPHNRTTKAVNTTTTASSYGISDMQEFAQLVELQDDELHERVALRYLRHYTGPLLFNICDYVEPNSRHVYLFNSSRVVLALHNFTMERMTVMLTPAWTLLSGMSQCSGSSLECQVYGTRICIDSSNACDGVPNCGAYDIYDEDRLMCGAADGLLHNVYLAAITFLAVMLTMIYTVHYWLRRCVPKVSEAFFIYMDGAENILYLETIMRSPHEVDEGPKMTYNCHLFEDEDYMPNEGTNFRQNIFKHILGLCLSCCKCKRKEKQLSDEILSPKQLYSFAELELTKMMVHEKGKEAGVQTGDSLERTHTESKKKTPFQLKSLPERPMDNRRMAKVATESENDFQKHVHELNMLKLLKELKTEQDQSPSRATATSSESVEGKLVDKPSLRNLSSEPHLVQIEEEEEELQTHFYDHQAVQTPGSSHRVITTTCDIHPERPTTSKQAKKCLRFEEETITIPSVIDEDDYQVTNYDSKDHYEDDTQGSGRDFRRFWKTKKSKKKKTHLALH